MALSFSKFHYWILILLSVIVLQSCSSMKSGHYVMVKPQDTLESLAKEFNVAKEKISMANPGVPLIEGAWIFIPLKAGIIERFKDGNAYDPQRLILSGEFLWPVPSSNKMSSGYGMRWGKLHEGVDIPGHIGAHIVAAADGVVVYSGNEIGGYGNITVIAHKNGHFSVYAHAKTNLTKKGQRVFRGQVIAQIGMTGRTYGPHLHFEIRKNGEPIDPAHYLASN